MVMMPGWPRPCPRVPVSPGPRAGPRLHRPDRRLSHPHVPASPPTVMQDWDYDTCSVVMHESLAAQTQFEPVKVTVVFDDNR